MTAHSLLDKQIRLKNNCPRSEEGQRIVVYVFHHEWQRQSQPGAACRDQSRAKASRSIPDYIKLTNESPWRRSSLTFHTKLILVIEDGKLQPLHVWHLPAVRMGGQTSEQTKWVYYTTFPLFFFCCFKLGFPWPGQLNRYCMRSGCWDRVSENTTTSLRYTTRPSKFPLFKKRPCEMLNQVKLDANWSTLTWGTKIKVTFDWMHLSGCVT